MKDGKFVILAADDEVELLDALELFMGKENGYGEGSLRCGCP